MNDWGFEKAGETLKNWPKTETGEPEPPAFLQHVSGSELDVELTVNLLSAYEIPAFCAYTNNGEFGKLILGFAGTGTDIYVPESLMEDARNILSADIQMVDELEDETENTED